MKASGKKIALPLILLIILCLTLSAIIGIVLYLRAKDAAYVPYRATPSPDITSEPQAAAPSSTPTPFVTVSPVPAAEATPSPDWQFPANAERFWSDGALFLSDSYRSPDLTVTVKTVVDTVTFNRRVTYYVADIYVRDITAIRTESCMDDFTKTGHGSVERTAKRVNALIAISGDYYGARRDSLVIRNGEVYRAGLRNNMDICLLLKDGTMETYRAGTISLSKILEKDVWQAWQFGPVLLKANGDSRTSFPESTIFVRNPRCVIGYCEPGHYKFVVVDGRQKASRGVTLPELSQLMVSLGCAQAFNLDGGASAHFYWNDEIYSNPSGGGRQMSDIIYIAKEDYPASPYHHGKDGIDE